MSKMCEHENSTSIYMRITLIVAGKGAVQQAVFS